MSVANGSTVLTGHGGKVMAKSISGAYYLIARIKQWNLTYNRTEGVWGDSDSGGSTNRVGGRRDATGSITGVTDKDHPAYNDVLFDVDDTNPNNNDMVTLLLWEDGNETTPKDYWYFPRALITSFAMGIDNDSKLPVDWTASFGTDGVFYKPRETGTLAYTSLMVATFRTLPDPITT